MEPVTVKTICETIRGKLLQGRAETLVEGIATDSRTLKPGELFFALKGERLDGHTFLKEAFSRGAVGAVVSRKEEVLPKDKEKVLILVPDTLGALHTFAGAYRQKFSLLVVAVTGSSGKTTTKDLIAAALKAYGLVLKTPGNFNNEIGLPLTLLACQGSHRVAVLEMGMRGEGEIRALCRLAQPRYGVITNIGTAHYARLGSQEAIARAKGELLTALPPTGAAFLNGDDPWCRKLALSCPAPVFFYGLCPPQEVLGFNLRPEGRKGTYFVVEARGERGDFFIPLLGTANVRNALAAIAVGLELGLSLAEMAADLREPELSGGRLEMVPGINRSLLIDATYNANPEAVCASLEVLALVREKRAIAVLGEMQELGAQSLAAAREVGKEVVARAVDFLVTVGQGAKPIAEEAAAAGMPEANIFKFTTNRETQDFLSSFLRPGDVVLIKGSRGLHLEEISNALRA